MKRLIPWIMVALAATPALGAVPKTMSYQGVLADGAGSVVPDGNYSLTFNVYDDATLGGAHLLWTEAHNGGAFPAAPQVAVSRGGFSTILGTTVPLDLAFDRQYWLGVQIGADPELSPRIALASSPYSLRSTVAEGLSAPITGAQVLDGSLGSVDLTPTFAHSGAVATTTIGSSWTNYSGAQVTINAPGPGYVVVDSDFWLLINHVTGTADIAQIGIATAPAVSPGFVGLWSQEVPASIGTKNGVNQSGHVQFVFVVLAGPQTYYLNGQMINGQDASDVFWFANMSAVYYYNASPSVPAASARVTLEKLEQIRAMEARAGATK